MSVLPARALQRCPWQTTPRVGSAAGADSGTIVSGTGGGGGQLPPTTHLAVGPHGRRVGLEEQRDDDGGGHHNLLGAADGQAGKRGVVESVAQQAVACTTKGAWAAARPLPSSVSHRKRAVRSEHTRAHTHAALRVWLVVAVQTQPSAVPSLTAATISSPPRRSSPPPPAGRGGKGGGDSQRPASR